MNLDDFFAVVCTGFHEVVVCTRYALFFLLSIYAPGLYHHSPVPLSIGISVLVIEVRNHVNMLCLYLWFSLKHILDDLDCAGFVNSC